MATRPARPAPAAYDPLAAARATIAGNMATASATPVRLPFDDQEGCLVFALKSARFQMSNNPKKVGMAFFCAELEVLESSHPRCVVGKQTSWTRYCTSDINNKEIAAFLFALVGLALSDEEIGVLLVDDGAVLKGCKVQVDMVAKHSTKHDKTFFNPHWSHVELTQAALEAIEALDNTDTEA